MKMIVKQNWNFIRLLRLFAGAAGTIQGVLLKEFELSIAGFLLVYMAIADGLNKNYEMELKELDHEKVDARL